MLCCIRLGYFDFRVYAGENVAGAAADFQTQDTIFANGNHPRIHAGIGFQFKRNTSPAFTQLNLQLFRLNHFQLSAVRTLGGCRCRGGKAQNAGHCQNKRQTLHIFRFHVSTSVIYSQ